MGMKRERREEGGREGGERERQSTLHPVSVFLYCCME